METKIIARAFLPLTETVHKLMIIEKLKKNLTANRKRQNKRDKARERKVCVSERLRFFNQEMKLKTNIRFVMKQQTMINDKIII